MKKQLVHLLALAFVLITAASCSSSKNTSSSRYPSGTGTRSQRTSDIPGILFPGSRTSTQGMPPGQAKKVYGDQSAKAYAPGQQKKAGNVVYRTSESNSKAKGKGKGKGKGKKH
ncbi:hypothetical protein [Rufibacter soli]